MNDNVIGTVTFLSLATSIGLGIAAGIAQADGNEEVSDILSIASLGIAVPTIGLGAYVAKEEIDLLYKKKTLELEQSFERMRTR